MFFAVTVDDALKSVAFALASLMQIDEAIVTLVKGRSAFQALKACYFTFTSGTINLTS